MTEAISKGAISWPLGKRFKIGRHDATLILITTLAQVELRLIIDAAFQVRIASCVGCE